MIKRKANPDDKGCPHNRYIECPGPTTGRCYNCGWNPAVSKKRVRTWLKGHKGKVFIVYRRRAQ